MSRRLRLDHHRRRRRHTYEKKETSEKVERETEQV